VRYGVEAMIQTRLSEVLAPELIFLGLSAQSLMDGVRASLPAAMKRAGLTLAQQETILRAIEEREKSASTIAPPIALPHARQSAAPQIVAALAINRQGIVGDEVQVLVPFVSPEAAAAEHLRFLSGMVRLFRARDVLDELLDAHSPDQVLAVLRARNG
jgi:mannitol/fructose-specific phosphotransferase system IIA component (Ntr-type)